MSASQYVRTPLFYVFGAFLVIIIIIISVALLAPQSGAASSGVVDFGTEMTNTLPYIGLLLVAGLVVSSLGKGK